MECINIINFNEMHYIWLKERGHPFKNVVAVPGRVGLEVKRHIIRGFFFLGTWADFYQQLKLDSSRHFSESI